MNDGSTRDRIIAFVRENPGAAKIEVCQGLDVGWGTTTHHLYRLEREGHVAISRHRGRVALFSVDVPERVRECLATLRDPETRSLLAHLETAGDTSLCDLVAETHLSRRVLSRHLGALTEVGLVEKRGHHRPLYRTGQPIWDLRRRKKR